MNGTRWIAWASAVMRRAARHGLVAVAAALALWTVAAGAATVDELAAQARAGNAQAQYQLGMLYGAGDLQRGARQDWGLAAEWLKKAAENKHVAAQYEYAKALYYGRGVATDRAAAMKWYRNAAQAGYVDAQNMLVQLEYRARTEGADDGTTTSADRVAAGIGNVTALLADWAGRVMDATAAIGTGADATAGASGKYWPWWVGAIAMGLLTVGFWYVVGAPLGVSSSWDRIVRWREARELAQAQAVVRGNRVAVQDAMLAAAIEQFGEDYVRRVAQDDSGSSSSPAPAEPGTRAPWQAHITFLAMLAVGGWLAATASGDFALQMSLGSEFDRLFGGGWPTWAMLIGGGALVGFGARMGGGCTSGHGLSGCSRLQPGSLVGTAAFFGTAIVVSLLLEKWL